MSAVDSEGYQITTEYIDLIGTRPEGYKNKPLGTIQFDEGTKIVDGKTYVKNKWTWVGGTVGYDSGDFKWTALLKPGAAPHKTSLIAIISFSNELINGEILNLTRWKQKKPPDRPWFKDGDTIVGNYSGNQSADQIDFNGKVRK